MTATVTVVGAGVAGLVTAVTLSERGAPVEVIDRASGLGAGACSWFAGGMLAPWCERESAEPEVETLGQQALTWWPAHFGGTIQRGTVVVAPPRDTGELRRFASRANEHEWVDWVDAAGLALLEPDLADRFQHALFFPREAHLDPREALAALYELLRARGVPVRFGEDGRDLLADTGAGDPANPVVDCRGYAARDALPDLRGVRGEMVVVRTPEVTLHRPVRLLHPRFPCYIVPRADHHFMIGATMIESDRRGPVTVRSAVELLNAAYTVHPAFGEAEIVEFGADIRPTFPDNLPRVTRRGAVIRFNGLFRHGFLLSPAFADRAAAAAIEAMGEQR